MRAFRAGVVAQFITLVHAPTSLLTLAAMPLSTVAFLAVIRHAGRGDLVAHALVAPVLMAQWAMALTVAGELVESERRQGTLELLVASPVAFPVVLAARVTAVTVASMVSVAEVWVVATRLFDLEVQPRHLGLLLVGVAANSVAVAGWATALSAALVLVRSPRVLQSNLSFPFYLLGGVLVPVSFLPAPFRLVSRTLFLSWSADLLRDAYRLPHVPDAGLRLAVVVGSAVAGFALGDALVARALHRLRSTGRLTLA